MSVSQLFNRRVEQWVNRCVNQSVDRRESQAASRSVCQSVSESLRVKQRVGQSVSESLRVKQWVSQSVNQLESSVSKWVDEFMFLYLWVRTHTDVVKTPPGRSTWKSNPKPSGYEENMLPTESPPSHYTKKQFYTRMHPVNLCCYLQIQKELILFT